MLALLRQIEGVSSHFRWSLMSSPLIVMGTFTAILVGIALALWGSRLAALVLLPLAVVWVYCNGLVEGPTLLRLSASHGVTAADLLSVVAVIVALGTLVLTASRRPVVPVKPGHSASEVSGGMPEVFVTQRDQTGD